jgi:transcriptional regulator with XRE-family HTH domain
MPAAMTDMTTDLLGNTTDTGDRHSPQERIQIRRFIKAIGHALVVGGMSQRDLCARLGISVGTMTKYLRGSVAPLKVGTGIQRLLATQLGVTLDALVAYYETGEYGTSISLDDVASWIRSDAGQRDLPEIMASLQQAGSRWIGGPIGEPEPQALVPERYDWPKKELENLRIPASVRGRLGLSDEALEKLSVLGEFDGDMVEGFAALIGVSSKRAREAFEKREPIPE